MAKKAKLTIYYIRSIQAKVKYSDALVGSGHSSQKQSTTQNQYHLCKMPYPRCQTKLLKSKFRYKILKFRQNIKFQIEAKSYIQKIITEVLIL